MLRDVKGLGMNFQVGSWEVSTWESVFLCCVCVVVSSEASGVCECVSVLREIGNWKLEIGGDILFGTLELSNVFLETGKCSAQRLWESNAVRPTCHEN